MKVTLQNHIRIVLGLNPRWHTGCPGLGMSSVRLLQLPSKSFPIHSSIILPQILCFCTLSIIQSLENLPVYFSKHSVSETGFCLRLQVKLVQLGPMDIASPTEQVLPEDGGRIKSPKLVSKYKQDGVLDNNRTMYNVQKHNILTYHRHKLLELNYDPADHSGGARGLRHKLSSHARTLESWVRIPLKVWMSVLCAFILCLCRSLRR
jgi:hypothetical protein